MRFLVDANLSPRIATLLASDGHDALHVRDVGLLTASDEKIMAFARVEDRVIVSADSDFATMLALGGMIVPSVILLRSADHLRPDAQAALLLANLATVAADLAGGAVVSLSANHLRARRLPL